MNLYTIKTIQRCQRNSGNEGQSEYNEINMAELQRININSDIIPHPFNKVDPMTHPDTEQYHKLYLKI